MLKISSRKVARIKLGIEVSSVVRKIIMRSGSLFRIRAAILPSTVPVTSATAIAIRPSLQEMGKDSAKIAEISRPFFRLTPKSP